MKLFSFCLIALSFKVFQSNASPGGAPQRDDVCTDMLPRHGVEAQTSPSPFELNALENNIKGGERLRITIRTSGSATFKGFLLQARSEQGNEIVGEFYEIPQSEPFNFRNCALKNHNCVTHANNDAKVNITFDWKAPYDFEGKIYFIATVIQEKVIFWSDIRSQLINVTLSDENVPGYLDAKFYEDCGVTKTCFGVPDNCVRSKNCDYLGSFRLDDGKYKFEIKSPVNAAWAAIGLSEDTLMGSDSVIECVKEGNAVKAYTSFTRRGTQNYGADRILVDQSIINLDVSIVENGVIYCLVERQPTTDIEGFEFDLTSKNYFLLLATGNNVTANSVSYHGTTRSVSPKSISFKGDSYEILGNENVPGLDEIYDDCGIKKTCFGVPDNCVKSKNCDYFTSFTLNNSKYNFELKSPISATWVGAGLSEDTQMGSDLVLECVKEGNAAKAYVSFTTRGAGNYGAHRSRVNQSTIILKTSIIKNGIIYCLVEKTADDEIEGIQFDLTTKHFYLLLATGSDQITSDSISYHGTTRSISPKSVSFKGDVYEILGADEKSRVLIILHGSFMVVAWIGLTSIGIITARYFKTLLGDVKIANKDIWFRIHQVCMSLTLLLTIAAITIIWIDVGQWKSSWHSIVGIITGVLCFLQGFLGIFRPSPTDPARPVFNFMHGSVGKLAHFLGVITIFLATSLEMANLPAWTKYLVAAYIISYLIFYVIFMNLSLIGGILSESDESVNNFEGARKSLFGVFLVLIISFTIAVICAIAV